MKVLLLNASPKTTGATQWIADAVKAALPDGTETTSRSMADAEFALCIGQPFNKQARHLIHLQFLRRKDAPVSRDDVV